MRSFLSFAIIITVSVVLVISLAYRANHSDVLNVNVQNISNYLNELTYNAQNPSIPVKSLFGEDGWLDIVDMQGNIIYPQNSERSYTIGELECIADFGSGISVRATRFTADNEEYNYLITKTYPNGDEVYLLLRSDLSIDTGSMPTTKNQYTQREFDLLIYNTTHGDDVIEKYYFESEDGTPYYAIYLDANNDDVTPPYLFVALFSIGILALLILSLVMYIRYINKHVQKPLFALENAMDELSTHNYRKKIEYHGSKEFEHLVESFNDMADLLNQSEQQRDLLEQDRQRMLAGLSHDLKTPITVIQGFAKAIRDGLVDKEDEQKYLNLIVAKSEHMSKLVNEFNEYSRLEHPDFKLSIEQLDVAELVRTYFADIYDEFALRGYSLDAQITEQNLICDADRAQLVRMLENMVSNFFKYTPEGSTLYICVREDGDDAYICIADNGKGIAEEARADIFSPFVVGEKSRNKQGSGLGLAICEKIVSAHGGQISLCDTPIEGYNLQFDIRIPLHKDEPDEK